MMNTVQEISSIQIFPEGTRNKTNSALGEFYTGAFSIVDVQQYHAGTGGDP